MTTPCSIRVVHSPDRSRVGVRRTLNSQQPCVIGRDVGDADEGGIRIADSRMSRLHARLLWDARQASFRVGDAGSRNGLFLNAERIQTELIRDGDVLRCGDSLLVFEQKDRTAELRAQAERVAESELTVLLNGETGTGKEVLAQHIHQRSGRTGPFLAVNCATLSRDLAAAELFGHTRGAFSGAQRARPGLFIAASQGTLLLDEIGELPLDAQAVLLRALQEKTVRQVGAEREQSVDVRVIAATHRDLELACQQGRFREDLYARLAQVQLTIAPLRERRSEILALVQEFCQGPLDVTTSAAEALLLWDWPHNVRELQALIQHFLTLGSEDRKLSLHYLEQYQPRLVKQAAARAPVPGEKVTFRRSTMTAVRLNELLSEHSGNISAVARQLGKPRAQIYRWMKAFGVVAKE